MSSFEPASVPHITAVQLVNVEPGFLHHLTAVQLDDGNWLVVHPDGRRELVTAHEFGKLYVTLPPRPLFPWCPEGACQ
jgi:hypothetical protein